MHFDNKIKFLIVFATLVATGCVSHWSGPNGHGTTSPVYSDYESTSEFRSCISNRRVQRRELLCDAGIITGDRCNLNVRVGFREGVQLICTQLATREAEGGTREPGDMTRARCNQLLGQLPVQEQRNAISVERVSNADPRMQTILAMNPALWQDDDAFCRASMSGYGVPASGGYAVAGGVPMAGGYAGVGVGFTGGDYRSVPYEVSSSTSFPISITMTAITPGMGVAAAPMGGFTLAPFQSQLVNLPSTNQVLFRVTCSNGGTFSRTYFPGHSLGWSGVTDQECTSAPGAVFLH